MREALSKLSGWKVWALAAVPAGCAAVLLLGLGRRAKRKDADAYAEWWRQRDQVRTNGASAPLPPPDAIQRTELFV